jgi:hypothetical protein
MKRWLGILGVLLLASFSAAQLNGQGAGAPPPPNGATQDQSGPPPGVARISFIHGDASTQRGDSGDWVGAVLNTPVLAGDKLSTADAARLEVQLDFANILRLAGRTQTIIATLGENHIQIQVAQGLVEYTVLKGSDSDIEIDTPNVSVRPLREGSYRIQVNDDGETLVIIRDGEAEVSTPQGSTKVGRGQMITIHGTNIDAQFRTSNAPGRDDWDKWNEDRDRIISRAESWNHTSPYYTGTHDLDAYGNWENVPDYGSAWAPNVGPEWSPYSDGDFTWEPYYGWTWISNEPWGWAPYHYGRWFRYSNRWMWWPGPVYRAYRPIWAPAYVSFFGFGGNFGVGFGFGFGSIGWFPTGPCDPFFPWYGIGFGARFNFVSFHDRFDFRFRDRRDFDDFHHRWPGAHDPLSRRFDERFSNFHQAERDPHIMRSMHSVRSEDFGRGGAGRRNGVSPAEFREGRMMAGNVPVVPTRESLRPGGREASRGSIPRGGQQDSHFFQRNQPRPVGPQHSFSEQAGQIQESLRRNGQNSVQGGAGGQTRFGGGTQQNTPNGNDGRRERNGMSQPPNVDSANPGGRNPDSGPRPGWQRFDNGGNNNGGSTPPVNRGGGGSQQRMDRPPVRSFEGQGTRPPENSQVQPARPQNSQPERNRGGWQQFTPQPNQGQQGPPNRGNGGNGQYGVDRPNGNGQINNDRPNGQGYQQPYQGQQGPPNRGNGGNGQYGVDRPNGNGQINNDRPNGQGYQQPTQPRYQGGQGYGNAPNNNGNNNARPPLEMRRPIVNERPQPQQGGGGNRYTPPPAPQSRPSYSPPPSRPSYTPPPSRPSYSPPPSRPSNPPPSRPSYSPPPSRPSGGSAPPSRPSGGAGGGGSHGSSGGGGGSHGSSGGNGRHH